jgi:DNA-binding XRE family transcriptional regulator
MTAIQKYRKQKNMTQKQLAEAVGVTQGAVNQWEKGATNPKIETLVVMAKLFDCTLEDLVKGG